MSDFFDIKNFIKPTLGKDGKPPIKYHFGLPTRDEGVSVLAELALRIQNKKLSLQGFSQKTETKLDHYMISSVTITYAEAYEQPTPEE